ncbi:vomeronasal type-2 receptor 116-like [Xenopus tropicalis]|uniref:Vomeronasal type-2 receptor 116-like n=1 Tax=Xenopus tropicalis TaxID=8364 RepID=A0A8J1J1Y9_XENTR|nr:vomeronasal type-2 receptor 116-like [Xenopus tropicalis]
MSGAAYNPFILLIYLTALYVGPCRPNVQPPNPACRLEIIKTYEEYEYIQEGDIMIGGVLTMNSYAVNFPHPEGNSSRILCVHSSPQYYRHYVDFLFAIENINKDRILLPNLTLGYHIYDSCGDARKAVRSVLQILSGTREPVPNYSCVGKRNIAGFIGDFSSETTLPIAQILSLFGYTQISHGATDPMLSDRVSFPYFFRLLQSDAHYAALAKFLDYFGWTWVGIIRTEEDSEDREHQLLTKHLSRLGICVAFDIKMKKQSSMLNKNNFNYYEEWKRIIKQSSANVTIIFGTFSATFQQELIQLIDVLDKNTVVFTSTWPLNGDTLNYTMGIVNGSLIIIQKASDFIITKIEHFLQNIHPYNYPEDKVLEDIWMQYHFCSSEDQDKNELYKTIYSGTLHNCTGQEHITDIGNFNNVLHSPLVYSAVRMMYRALYMMHFSFSSKSPPNNKRISSYRNQIPRAQCSDNCLPGFRKAPRPGAQSCCYDCVPCSEGEISNSTDSISCFRCSDMEWPNENKNQCIARTEQFLSYTNDVISIIFSSISVLFFLITLLILGVFISYRDSPIVRANNRSLSFLLLVSIKLSFLSVFLFLGRPVDITCMLRIITFGITFSIAVSSLLAKTIMVCVAFKATKPGSSWRKWLGVKLSNSVVLFCSSIQIIICMTWLAISPPFQELDIHTSPGTIIIQCNEGSAIGFYSVIGYMGLLAAVSFVLAFLARSLPDSFNEAKYITFSMLLFCSVWITMIPAYLSTKGKNTVCVEIFAILTSSAGLLACIFLPKCYVIMFRPELNTKSCLFEHNSR